MQATTLDSVIKEYLIQEGKDSLHDYKRYELLALGVLRDLHYNVDGVAKVVVLDISDNGVANLPEDFLKETRVAIVDGDGMLKELSPNSSISLNRNIDTDCEVNYTQEGVGCVDIDLGTAHFANGQNIGRYYGLGGHNMYGEYRIDRTHNVITFNSTITYSQVTLEYIGNYNISNGDIIIDPRAIDVIKKGIYARKVAMKGYVGRGEKDAAARDYEAAKMNYKIALRMPTKSAILSQSRRTFKLSPKL